MGNDDVAMLNKTLRTVKLYAFATTVLFLMTVLSGFSRSNTKPDFDSITAKEILLVDSIGKARVRISADLKRGGLAGLFFYNEDGTEAGALAYRGKRDKDGRVTAGSIFTMDQFKDDQIVVLDYYHDGDQKRLGLTINDRPNQLSTRATQLLDTLRRELQTAKSTAEAQIIRRKYLSRLPARELVARRLFAGRDTAGSSVVTLSDQDGKPRLRLSVDKAGEASIVFLDSAGLAVRTIKPGSL
jgi:hypothetical protein